MQMRDKKRAGFTLVEVMVVISIISFLSSVLLASTTRAKAKAIDVKTVTQTQQFQKALLIKTNNPMAMPDTYTASNNSYYCLGKAASEHCTFWGSDFTGHSSLASIVSTGGSMGSVVIGGQEYNGIVYQCTEASGGTCTKSAVYWAQSGTTCTTGKLVLSGSGGVVCGQNGGVNETTNVVVGNGGPLVCTGGDVACCPSGFSLATVDAYRYFCHPNITPNTSTAACPSGYHVDLPQTYTQSIVGWICETNTPDMCNNSCVYPEPCTQTGPGQWRCFST